MKVICTPKRREWLGPGDGRVGKKRGERPTESRSRAHVQYIQYQQDARCIIIIIATVTYALSQELLAFGAFVPSGKKKKGTPRAA